jgi:hypothetical protein
VISASLSELNANGNIRAHEHKDVVVVKVATVNPEPVLPNNSPAPTPQAQIPPRQMKGTAGVRISLPSGTSVLGFAPEAVRTYDQVLVGNDVIVYGYPRSLGGLSNDKQFDLDPLRPLLRKGLIAGLNGIKRTIILDCPSYRGNSGGPAVEIEPTGLQRKFLVIGVITEFVPLMEVAPDLNFALNSGYSVVEPMDAVLELTK